MMTRAALAAAILLTALEAVFLWAHSASSLKTPGRISA